MKPAAIELVEVTKDYGRVRAVDRLSLKVPEGSLFGLIGPNGAGKTTTFGLLSGFLRPSGGEVRVRGARLTARRPPVGQVLSLPQDAALPGQRRVLETLVFLARLGGFGGVEAEQAGRRALERVGLAELADRRIHALSHGQRRRVGIAQTLVGRDEVILLDEPTAGLDPRTALELGALIVELARERTIVLSSHNLSEVESLCTHAAILHKGTLVASGTMDELKGTGQRLEVELARPLAAPEPSRARLAAIAGVSAVSLSSDGCSVEVVLARAELADQVTGEVLRALLEQGAAVKGVERGKRLEQRFMEETRR
jgi:ABC-2 type transport system ATP-binding protein